MNKEDIKIGLKVNYYSIIENGIKLNKKETQITSKPWMLGHGEWVCKVKGISGCVSLSHLELINN